MQDFLRLVIFAHIVLGFTAFFALAPLALTAVKGSPRHRCYGRLYGETLIVFYALGQTVTLCRFFFLNEIGLMSLAKFTLFDIAGIVPVIIAYMAVRHPQAIRWRRILTFCLLISGALLVIFFIMIHKRHRFISLGVIAMALALKELRAENTKKPLQGVELHMHYMIGAFAFVMVFQCLSVVWPFYSEEVKWCIAAAAGLPVWYVVFSRLDVAAARRVIPPQLKYWLIVSYAAGFLSSVQYHNVTLLCGPDVREKSAVCQAVIGIQKQLGIIKAHPYPNDAAQPAENHKNNK